MKKGKLDVNPMEIRAIKALHEKEHSTRDIATILHVKEKNIKYVISHLYKYQDILAPMTLAEKEKREAIADFERILIDKKGSAEQGEKLYNYMTDMSVTYRHNVKADSQCKFNMPDRYTAIAALSDFHIGHEGIDYNRLRDDIQLISNTPNMYMTFLGDAIDNFINEKHLGAIINAVTSPKQQLYMLQYIFKVLKEPKKKILFATKDNHVSQRLKKATGIDWSNKMWSDIGVFYGGEEVKATVNVGKQPYVILARHSFRGQSSVNLTAGGKKLLREGQYENVDIVMMAHKHEGAAEMMHYRGQPKTIIQTSTYKLFDPYAAHLGYHSPEVFMPCTILSPDRKAFVLCPDLQIAATMLEALNRKR